MGKRFHSTGCKLRPALPDISIVPGAFYFYDICYWCQKTFEECACKNLIISVDELLDFHASSCHCIKEAVGRCLHEVNKENLNFTQEWQRIKLDENLQFQKKYFKEEYLYMLRQKL